MPRVGRAYFPDPARDGTDAFKRVMESEWVPCDQIWTSGRHRQESNWWVACRIGVGQ